MGYEIKIAEIQAFRRQAITNAAIWQQQLQKLQEDFQGLDSSLGMEGAAADRLRGYMTEIHGTILDNMRRMLAEYCARLAVYEQGYQSIDSDSEAVLNQDIMDERYLDFQKGYTAFEDLDDGIVDALTGISDICSITTPSSSGIKIGYQEIMYDLNQLRDRVGTYENAHRSDCQPTGEYIQAIRAFIDSYSGTGQVNISTYQVGGLMFRPEFDKLKGHEERSNSYIADHQEEIGAVSERMADEIQKEIDAAVAERRTQGIYKIVDGILIVGGVAVGVAAVVLSGGTASPVVAALMASGGATMTLYGGSNIIEGGYDIHLAEIGDITSVACNPVRDTLFMGNQTAYDVWGTIGDAMFMGGGVAQSILVTSRVSNVTAVDDLAKRAEVKRTGGAGKASNDIIFGSGTKSSQKLSNQMKNRGWTQETVKETVDSSFTTRTSVNKATQNPATVYYTESGSYVIIDDVTKEIVQVSDNINPSTWAPDSSIVDPFVPD